ncbi:nucleotide-diphospho-sugar transferase [Aspergillus granulosus]|uniref:Nucleotide-diphospho-sugar transferase n=1 Tax=Aspergillus granulosus TaxID=176169 RepID=A0ABR4H190_9EURO
MISASSRAVCKVSAVTLLFVVAVSLLRLPTRESQPSILNTPISPVPGLTKDNVDWSRFAYAQYATNTDYLCNSVMLFETLHRLRSKAQRLLMYPSSYSVNELDSSRESWLLRKARDEYGVTLIPVEIQTRHGDDSSWAESYTKLLAFNQTQYDRVLSLDSDATMLKHLDELFLMPPCPVAMPRAYWLDQNDHFLTSLLLLIKPSQFEFDRVMTAVSKANPAEYDMDILNRLYKDSALVLPHRPYALLTGVFRSNLHSRYLGNSVEEWNPAKIIMEAKFVHFSDWPIPKPWITADPAIIQKHQPACNMDPETDQDDCRSRDIWLDLYREFADRRKRTCEIGVTL